MCKRVVAVYRPPNEARIEATNKNYGDNSRSSNDACEDVKRGEAGSWQMEISRSANEASKRGRDWRCKFDPPLSVMHWPPGLSTHGHITGGLLA